eukprot:3893086-Alexandrium_andersonii.AAC.1
MSIYPGREPKAQTWNQKARFFQRSHCTRGHPRSSKQPASAQQDTMKFSELPSCATPRGCAA